MCSLLFVADIFTRMLFKVARHSSITGLMHQMRRGGGVSLKYVDDTLLYSREQL